MKTDKQHKPDEQEVYRRFHPGEFPGLSSENTPDGKNTCQGEHNDLHNAVRPYMHRPEGQGSKDQKEDDAGKNDFIADYSHGSWV